MRIKLSDAVIGQISNDMKLSLRSRRLIVGKCRKAYYQERQGDSAKKAWAKKEAGVHPMENLSLLMSEENFQFDRVTTLPCGPRSV
jgi:hypothetical protein